MYMVYDLFVSNRFCSVPRQTRHRVNLSLTRLTFNDMLPNYNNLSKITLLNCFVKKKIKKKKTKKLKKKNNFFGSILFPTFLYINQMLPVICLIIILFFLIIKIKDWEANDEFIITLTGN